MGICTSNETRVKMQMNHIPPNYLKEKKEAAEPMTVEHANYDYTETRQEVEHQAVICLPHSIGYHPDRIAIVDLNETSPTYSQITFSVELGDEGGEEPGRMNWTRSAANLENMKEVARSHLVVPCMNSNRIYVVALEAPNTLRVVKVISSSDLTRRDVSCPYAVHSLPMKGAPVHVSTMGDKDGHGKGDFLLLDRNTFELRDRHNKDVFVGFGGDFSLQTRHNLLISCEWGHPRLFRNGFTANDIEKVSGSYGSRLHVWQISPGKLKQTIDLGPVDGCLTTTVRFLHNADCNHAFACSAIGSTIFHLFMESVEGVWTAHKVAYIPTVKVSNWLSEEMPALLTDLVISMDDRWLYVCGWLHGCIWQFDISDPFRVSLAAKISLGGLLVRSSDVIVESRTSEMPSEAVRVRGSPFRGGPAGLQLSLDGRRMYVTNSFYKPWDAQFYPEIADSGGQIIRIDVATGCGGMRVNEQFLLDLEDYPGGPYVARDIRFFGGDCTGDNFM